MSASATRGVGVIGALGVFASVLVLGAWVVAGSSSAVGSSAGGSTGAPAGGARRERAVLGPGPVTVRLTMEDSRFTPRRIRVVPYTEVRFEVVNRDFINHELIVGDDAVHARHEGGHEPWHPPTPGEVSVAPHQTGVTTYALHEPGTVRFACHLPGHLAYGMKGTIVVEASRGL